MSPEDKARGWVAHLAAKLRSDQALRPAVAAARADLERLLAVAEGPP